MKPLDTPLPAVEAAPEAADLIPILRYSTSHLPPEERYEAWNRRDWPRRDGIFHTRPNEPFDMSWETSPLGPVTFVYTEITGMLWERRIDDVRRSDFDPIVINMMIQGAAQGDMDGRAFHEPAGSLHFHDLGRPSLHVSTASLTYSVIIPRPVATELFGSLNDLHGLVIGGEAAAMLFAQAAQVRAALPRLRMAQAERLGRVFLELAAIAVAEVRPARSRTVTRTEVQRGRAEKEIEKRLGDGPLDIPALCRELGINRTRLFAMFRPDGGVQAFAMAERLKLARAALADLERAESVSAIAARLGFSDGGHLSHAFRRQFGMSPRDYRRLIDVDAT